MTAIIKVSYLDLKDITNIQIMKIMYLDGAKNVYLSKLDFSNIQMFEKFAFMTILVMFVFSTFTISLTKKKKKKTLGAIQKFWIVPT